MTARLPSLPGYEILSVLGRGGMGVVFKARHVALRRLVAIKMIVASAGAGPKEINRFRVESEAVACLQHPNIIQIFEVGEHEGLPFFAMELCSGGSLEKRLRESPLTPQDAAKIVRTLARAIHYAHDKRVIHRDLKPANILLAEDGTPKIGDFGLARKLEDAGQTATGAVMGTPSYMAPEQAGHSDVPIGPAADVYALGGILYECLTGRPPFKGASPIETIMQVMMDAPVSPRLLQPKTPKDLETIVLKCFAKAPGKRYATAQELAYDLERFQHRQPILARPIGVVERTSLWCKRRPAVAGLFLGLACVTLTGIGLVTWKWREAANNAALFAAQKRVAEGQTETISKALTEVEAAERLAKEREESERKAKDEAILQKKLAVAESARAEKAAEELAQQLEFSQESLLTVNLNAATNLLESDPVQAKAMLDDPTFCPVMRRDFAWKYFRQAVTEVVRVPVAKMLGATNPVIGVDLKHRLVAIGDGKATRITIRPLQKDNDLGSPIATWATPEKTYPLEVKFSPDGKLAATCSRSTFSVHETQTGKELGTWKLAHDVTELAFDAAGERLAVGSRSYSKATKSYPITILSLKSRAVTASFEGHESETSALAFSPTDGMVYSASRAVAGKKALPSVVHIWDPRTGKGIKKLGDYATTVESIAFSPGGTQFAMCSAVVDLHETSGGRKIACFTAPSALRFVRACFHPSKSLLCAASVNNAKETEVIAWDTETLQKRMMTRVRHGVEILEVAEEAIAAINTVNFSICKLSAAPPVEELAQLGRPVLALHPLPGSSAVVVVYQATEYVLLDTKTRSLGKPRSHGLGFASFSALSPDGKRIAFIGIKSKGTTERTVIIHDLATGDELLTESWKFAHRAEFFRDSSRVIPSKGPTINEWDLSKNAMTGSIETCKDPVLSIAIDRLGKNVAVGSGGGIGLWSRTTNAYVWSHEWQNFPGVKDGAVWDIAFSGDERHVIANLFRPGLVGSNDPVELRLYRVNDGKLLWTQKSQQSRCTSLCFHSQEATVLTASMDGKIRLFNGTTGQLRAMLDPPNSKVRHACFAANGRAILASGEDGAVWQWSLRP